MQSTTATTASLIPGMGALPRMFKENWSISTAVADADAPFAGGAVDVSEMVSVLDVLALAKLVAVPEVVAVERVDCSVATIFGTDKLIAVGPGVVVVVVVVVVVAVGGNMVVVAVGGGAGTAFKDD